MPFLPGVTLWGRRLAVVLGLVGLISRLAPLSNHNGRLLQQWPTEDGYLTLTIARNLALGRGMSVAEGETLTNGTQPLAALVWSSCFVVTGGDRASGVLLVQLLEIVLSVAVAWALFHLARRVLPGEDRDQLATLAAALWFSSPVVIAHSMNCLETSLYALAVLLVALASLAPRRHGTSWWRYALNLGLTFGLAFWARNDAVFLIGAVCVTHLLIPYQGAPLGLRARLRESVVAGALSVVIASPWLFFNYARFGHIVPVSGRAESLGAEFASNLHLVPTSLFEYALIFFPVPSSLDEKPWLIALTTVSVLALAALLPRVFRAADAGGRAVLVWGSLYALSLVGYYGLFFGAPHFVSRYMNPLSPLFVLLTVVLVAHALGRLPEGVRRVTQAAGAVVLVLVGVGLHFRHYSRGDAHQHFQVVDWVKSNVNETTWVAAVQTGTLGFFHERTINLDGKVNPAAYAAREKEGDTRRYLVESKALFVADWSGIASWASDPSMGKSFELVVNDPARNLAVLRRKTSER